MKRYMNLIQKILQYAECYATGQNMATPEIDGYTLAQVTYHIDLCEQAGFLRQYSMVLTWQGHEELEGFRRT